LIYDANPAGAAEKSDENKYPHEIYAAFRYVGILGIRVSDSSDKENEGDESKDDENDDEFSDDESNDNESKMCKFSDDKADVSGNADSRVCKVYSLLIIPFGKLKQFD
jgi:hypothetical protein